MDFDQIAEMRNKAYIAFCSTYQVENPPPERKMAQKENEREAWALGVIMLSSVTVSGTRTFAEFSTSPLGVLGGFAGLVMLEAAVIAYAYMRTAKFYTNERHQDVKSLLTKGMYLAFVVTLVTNTHITFKDAGVVFPEPFGNWINIGIFLLLALGAPTLALISGDVLAMLVTTDRYRQRQLDKEFDEAAKTYREEMNARWKLEQRKWGVTVQRVQVDRPEAVQLSAEDRPQLSDSGQRTADSGHGNGQGYVRRTDARTVVDQHLEANPQDMGMSVRELADKLGVGKSTVAEVLKQKRP